MTISAQTVDSLGIINFSDAVLELQNSELLKNGTLAISVKSTKDGKNVFSSNAALSLPPASTLKLVTTATAMSVFGGDYRFKTFLEYQGIIQGDTLFGNIYVRGNGDPTLGSDRFKGTLLYTDLLTRWAQLVAKTGIKVVKGKILTDASYFDPRTVPDSWIFADLGSYYGAGVSALNFNDNQYKIKLKPAAEIGYPVTLLGTDPSLPFLTFQNHVLTGERGSGDRTVLYSNPISNHVFLTGTIPQGMSTYTVKGAVPDPPGSVGFLLKEALRYSQIPVLESAMPDSLLALVGRKTLDEYTSPPLREISLQTNLWSVNLYADTFLKHLGKRLSGNSEFDAAALAMTNFWSLKNADMSGFFIKDGSGLSPSGSVTVHNLSDILRIASRQPNFDDFYKTIAVLGQGGTVRNLGKGTKAVGNIRAKSGSIEGTRAFAGYVTNKAGELMSFAIIAHKYQPGSQRMISDELVRLMVLMTDL